jgi:hypothetical protein
LPESLVPGRVEHELVEGEVTDRQRQDHDGDPVQPLVQAAHGIGVPVHLPVAPEAFRGQLEHPGEGQHRDEADRRHQHHDAHVVREPEGRKDGLGDLDRQPAQGHVARRDPEDMPSSEFVDQAHCRPRKRSMGPS